MSALEYNTARVAEAIERFRASKDPAAMSRLIEDAFTGDVESLGALAVAFGEDYRRVFEVWFTGRPGYTADDWFSLLVRLISFGPELPSGASES